MPRRSLSSLHACSLLFNGSIALAAPPLWHDEFNDLAAWKTVTADGVDLKLSQGPREGGGGQCIRLDYDFTRGSGYGIIRHEFSPPLTLPENYRFTFDIRGAKGDPRNTLEFKLINQTSENVWWVNQRNFEFPADWKPQSLQKRHFSFAWGPGGDGKPLTQLGAIEIAITSFNGGKGTVCLDGLTLEPLPAVTPYAGTPRVEVSSRYGGGKEPLAINADNYLGWRSAPADADPTPTAIIDFGQPREFGGVVLEWKPRCRPVALALEASLDAQDWTRIGVVGQHAGETDYVPVRDGLTRYIRLHCGQDEFGTGPFLNSVRIMPLSFGDSQNEMMRVVAADPPRGRYPRCFLNEKTYWTVVGVPGDDKEALINEEGAVEIDKLSLTLEPFISLGGRLITWNETTNTQTLADGYLPIPTVRRTLSIAGSPTLELSITPFTFGSAGESSLMVRYELKNIGDASNVSPREGTLWIAARPFQVNPPEQFLNSPGGVADVRHLRAHARGFVADSRMIISSSKSSSFGATAFSQGEIVDHLADGAMPSTGEVTDPLGMASGALGYAFSLNAGESFTVWFTEPLHKQLQTFPAGDEANRNSFLERLLAREQLDWQARLNKVSIRLPRAQQHIWDSVRSNLAYILINADGPGIQPGSRSYERTWIRDGCLTSAALLAFGFDLEVMNFLDWFAPYQYESGKIPCCVDKRGPDPVPENDSHGEYIFAVAEYYRHTLDADFLRRHWPHVLKAVAYISSLRDQRTAPDYADEHSDKHVFFGLMPESISHEGYSAKPMHSYWDDLFTLKGLADAEFIARTLDKPDIASTVGSLRDSFRKSLLDSIALSMKQHAIDYIPGCAELGDFDATSTTIALWPCGQIDSLPRAALDRTFDKYMAYFRERRDGTGEGGKSEAYTPYEWRIVGSLIRLDRRDDAAEVAAFLMRDQRPQGWNHWAEVVWKDPRAPKFIGDMPHTWVGSDFINSFRAMLAYERESDQSLVIAAGVPLDWFRDREGIEVKGLHTEYGRLNYTVSTQGPTTVISIEPGLTLPPGGLVIRPPEARLIAGVRVDGQEAPLGSAGETTVRQLPAKVEFDYR